MNRLRKSTLNRDLMVANDGWLHLLPLGEFPGRLVGVEGPAADIIQVCDAEAMNRIMSAFAEEAAKPGFKGLLLDKEHFSHDIQQSSEACAWIMKLENRADGIWGFPEWTDLGDALIKGKRYKGLSPALDIQRIADRRYRPVVLTDAGLTNAPKLPLKPICNRDGGDEEETGMNKLAEMLRKRFNLDAAADETAIIAALEKYLAEMDQQKTDLAKANEAAMNRDADAWVEKNKDRLTDPVAAKTLFTTNRQAAEAMLALVKPADKGRTLSRSEGKPPSQGAAPAGGADEAKTASALNRAARDYQAAHPGTPFDQAWAAVKETVIQA
ncbi:MAG: phage protease [Kiritimatiellia bacterium]